MELQFKTNLNCGSCVEKVKAYLDAEPSLTSWSVDTKDPQKILTVSGVTPNPEAIRQAIARGGFKILGPVEELSASLPVTTETYRPLILIFGYLLLSVILVQLSQNSWDVVEAMAHFMGGFFLVFSFFKFLDLQKFADAYASYDIIAKRARAYGFAYPFIELLLGAAYLGGVLPLLTNTVTLIVMGLSTVGVVQAIRDKRAIQCACLGTVFNLPMSKVTLFEDLLMVAMAVTMLVVHQSP
jgi:hypothetical protein